MQLNSDFAISGVRPKMLRHDRRIGQTFVSPPAKPGVYLSELTSHAQEYRQAVLCFALGQQHQRMCDAE